MKYFLLLFIISTFIFGCEQSKVGSYTTKDSTMVSEKPSIPEKPNDSLPPEKQNANKETFILIGKSNEIPGFINTRVISGLDSSLKAVAALYSALGGSNCNNDSCDLTTALGLGKQGSKAHLALLKTWFPADKAAQQLIAQKCYQRPSGASVFSDYEFLNLQRKADTVIVNYSLMIYDHGQSTYIKGPDKYLFNGKNFTTLNRNIWKDIK